MLVAAAICPSPPLLARELTGADPVVPELRAACADAVRAVLACEPGLVALVGAAPLARRWDSGAELDLSAFAPPLRASRPGSAGNDLPVALGLAGRLLDQAGYRGGRVLYSVAQELTPADCRSLGASLASMGERVALIAMADGSARRTLRAPGYLDERSEPFDAGVEEVIRSGNLDDLMRIDAGLARELMATGRPVWQVLAGAARGRSAAAAVHYRDDPFGVFYLVASLSLAESLSLAGSQEPADD